MADSCVLAIYKKENKLKQNQLHCKAEIKLRRIVNDVFGFRLTSEAVFNPYLVDFYVRNTDLAIEIDGGYHEGRMAYDNRRDMYLFEKYGLIVLRFTKDEIDNGIFRKSVWCACYGELIKKIRKINIETISRGSGAFIPSELKLL
jgi:very-short-patch-repair endonuclease